jgi:hypothetical protein
MGKEREERLEKDKWSTIIQRGEKNTDVHNRCK